MPTIRLNNINLYYERNGNGPPLVMLHGLGSLGADWMLQIPFFSNNYDVITPDLRGHGRSSKRVTYDISSLALDISDLLDALGMPAAHIVGLSLGSFVALQLALDKPQKVLSLTLVAACSRISNLGFWRLTLRSILIRCLPMHIVAKIVARTCFPGKNQLEFRKVCEVRIGRNSKYDYKALFEAIRRFDVYERLKEITCPVLIVAGAHDSLTPITEAKKIQEMIPQSHLEVIPDAGHVPPIEEALKFNQILNGFLKKNLS